MENILSIIVVVGIIETIVLIIGMVYAVVLWFKGILPVLYRLGNGLAKRRIAVFAKDGNLASLKGLLMDSRLFREKNICEITRKEDIGRAEQASVYLVFWRDWADDITEILNKKPDKCALVVYAPRDQGPIPEERMKDLDGERNTSVTNFRGRLLNDIITAMITTSL